MRVAFITDIHIDVDGKNPQGVDVRQNFQDALAELGNLKPNCIVLGGDLCNGSDDRAVYEWVKKVTDPLIEPCYVIAGNHDNVETLAEVFRMTHHLHDGELYYALPLSGHPALFLDSSKGYFSEEQWTWLRDYFKALKHSNILIFMHHPPLPADVLFMDRKYAFQQSERFLELVYDLPCHVTVVCGHYHVGKVVQRGNLLVLLSPSTFYQMKQDTPEFAIDTYNVGIRELNLTTEGNTSDVVYLEREAPAQPT